LLLWRTDRLFFLEATNETTDQNFQPLRLEVTSRVYLKL